MSDKSQAIVELHEQGLSIYQISKRLKTSYSYVQYTLDPEHPIRRQSRERLKRVIAEKFVKLLNEKRSDAEEVLEILRRSLEAHH